MWKDVTPQRFRCTMAPSCPAILIDGTGKALVIGKRVEPGVYPELDGRIGPHEAAIEIDAAMLEAYFAAAHAESTP